MSEKRKSERFVYIVCASIASDNTILAVFDDFVPAKKYCDACRKALSERPSLFSSGYARERRAWEDHYSDWKFLPSNASPVVCEHRVRSRS